MDVWSGRMLLAIVLICTLGEKAIHIFGAI